MTYSLGYDVVEPPTTTVYDPESPANDSLEQRFVAARNSAWYLGNPTAEVAAQADAMQQHLDRVRAATGVTLANPLYAPPLEGTELDDPTASPEDRAALQAYAADHPDYTPGHMLGTNAQIDAAPYQARAFGERLAALARQFPDHAAIIDPVGPDMEGAGLARQAAASDPPLLSGGLSGVLASLAGGFWGAMRDPFMAAANLVGGGEIGATSLAGRVIEGAARQSAVNAGVQALSEPTVQAWRQRAMNDGGLGNAAEDVGWAALFGAIPGAVIGGLSRPHVSPEALKTALRAASDGDPAGAAALARVAPDQADVIQAASQSIANDRAALPPKPPAFEPDALDGLFADAVDHGEDASAPLPEPATLAPKGATDDLAREALLGKGSKRSFWWGVQRVLGDDDLIDSALASDRPDFQAMGQIARMDPIARNEARISGIDPAFIRHVPALTDDPGAQRALVNALGERTIASEDEARAVLSRRLEAYNAAPMQAAVLPPDRVGGAEPPIELTEPANGLTEPPAAAPARRTPRAGVREPPDLVAYLRGIGGVKDPGGDLKALGFGALKSKNGLIDNVRGLDLDRARELAAEQGYLGADTDRAMGTTAVNDLLDALDSPSKIYSVHDADALHEWQIAQAEKARDPNSFVRPDKAEQMIRDAVGGDNELDPGALGVAVDHLASGRETDPVAAFDRAVRETESAWPHGDETPIAAAAHDLLMNDEELLRAGEHEDRLARFVDDCPF